MGTIKGTRKSDNLVGTNRADTIYGLGGNDTISAMQGNDKVYGGDGSDLIYLHSGNDMVDGGKGFDMIGLYYADAGVTLDLASKVVSIVAGGTSGTTSFKSIEGVWGSAHGDHISGDGKNNDIFSNEGNDTIFGRGGDDTINAYTGDDVIDGGAGDDWLFGGKNADTFIFTVGSGSATIMDFAVGKDKIDLSEYEGISTFEDLNILDGRRGARIELSENDRLSLDHVRAADLDASDFIFADTMV